LRREKREKVSSMTDAQAFMATNTYESPTLTWTIASL